MLQITCHNMEISFLQIRDFCKPRGSTIASFKIYVGCKSMKICSLHCIILALQTGKPKQNPTKHQKTHKQNSPPNHDNKHTIKASTLSSTENLNSASSEVRCSACLYPLMLAKLEIEMCLEFSNQIKQHLAVGLSVGYLSSEHL